MADDGNSVQRYEGGSTIYGPHTLEAYINIYGDMLGFIGDAPSGTPSQAGAPLDLTQNPLSLRVRTRLLHCLFAYG